MYSIVLAILLLADPPPTAPPAPAPTEPAPAVKLIAVPRSGYALVTAQATGDKPFKQVEYVVAASGTTGEVTYDQAGATLIVTLPRVGSVIVYAVVLLADGTLAPPVSTELAAPKPPVPQGRFSATLVLDLDRTKITQPEKDLLASKELKDGLAALNGQYLYVDVHSTVMAKKLADAKATNPSLPGAEAIPLLVVEDATGKITTIYKLTLGPTVAENVKAILDLLGAK